MQTFFCFQLLAALGICPEPYIYNPYSQTCFQLMDQQKTYANAKAECEGIGGSSQRLMTFKTAAASQWFREKAVELYASNASKTSLRSPLHLITHNFQVSIAQKNFVICQTLST